MCVLMVASATNSAAAMPPSASQLTVDVEVQEVCWARSSP